jgi:hypothetical protein
MRISTTTFNHTSPAIWRSADLQLAWVDAADDASEAYMAWRDADSADQQMAYFVYRAALDREEAAARAMQQHASACV